MKAEEGECNVYMYGIHVTPGLAEVMGLRGWLEGLSGRLLSMSGLWFGRDPRLEDLVGRPALHPAAP